MPFSPGDLPRHERQAFIMRQARAAKTLGITQKEFVETYGDIDFVPRQADMDPPVVANMVMDKRNQIETSDMNPLIKLIALRAFDRAFSEKTMDRIQKWEDMKYYWGAFKDLFRRKGKKAMQNEAFVRSYVRTVILEEKKKGVGKGWGNPIDPGIVGPAAALSEDE